jgi:flagellar FliJ protein
MSAFVFRLETLLKLRVAERDQRRQQLSEAYKAKQILDERSRQLAEDLRDLKGLVRQASLPGEINVDQLLITHRYELLLLAQSKQHDQQAQQITDEIERRRLALVEADRQVRVLEKLREKQLLDHQQRQHKLETKQFDEIAQRRAAVKDRT